MQIEEHRKAANDYHKLQAYSHSAQVPFDQYMTRRLEHIAQILDCMDLLGRKVIEIGIGKGALTELLIERGSHVIGYEIDPTITPESVKSKIDYREGDFKRSDFSYIQNYCTCLIANPPYRELGSIRESIICRYNLQEYLLCIPATQRMLFPEATVVGSLTGEDFVPAAAGQHLLVYFRARAEDCSAVLHNPQQFGWRDLAVPDLAHLPDSQIEQQVIDDMLLRVTNRIELLGEEQQRGNIILLLTEDLEKQSYLQKYLWGESASVVQAELYAHPDYIKKLLAIPQVSSVVRAESLSQSQGDSQKMAEPLYRIISYQYGDTDNELFAVSETEFSLDPNFLLQGHSFVGR
jgi:hypothetical protein